jgi:hypothetical protein
VTPWPLAIPLMPAMMIAGFIAAAAPGRRAGGSWSAQEGGRAIAGATEFDDAGVWGSGSGWRSCGRRASGLDPVW